MGVWHITDKFLNIEQESCLKCKTEGGGVGGGERLFFFCGLVGLGLGFLSLKQIQICRIQLVFSPYLMQYPLSHARIVVCVI